MHNKMIIVDSTTLFMGSWNMSYNDTFRNNNNLLQITSQKLIANYQAKFSELFVDKKFGTKADVGALTPQLTINNVAVENYFSPVDHVTDKLVAYVKGAKKSVKFMIFTYTDKDLSGAMIAQAQAGLKVQGVIENRGASQGAFVPIYCAGLPVEVDGNSFTMHHKVIIIDDETVITGSFNFTKSADDANDDNVLIIHSPTIAAQYNEEFARIYSQGKKPGTAPDCSK
jgi:phosphatidylserine/phosphatidylglycerophosphate/cardiolipin synthase-like enzyme